MDNISVAKEMESVTLRTEKIVYLATSLSESLADDVKELLEDSSVKELTEMFGKLPGPVVEALREGDNEELVMWLIDSEKFGFVFQFASPIHEQVGTSVMFWSYSWGYYRTKLIYGETIEKILRDGIEWAYECEKKDKAKIKTVEA